MLVWKRGLYDSVLEKVVLWAKLWETGKPAATRKRHSEQTGEVENVLLKRCTEIAWTGPEMQALIEILKDQRPEWEFVLDLDRFYHTSFSLCQPVPGPSGKLLRLVGVVSYQLDVKEILEAILAVKTQKLRRQVAEEVTSPDFWD